MLVAIVPPTVLKNRKALTANDLLSAEIVFTSIVIAGAIQFSAVRYSSASIEIENAKPPVDLIWGKAVNEKKMLPNIPLKMQMYAFVMRMPFCSYLSPILPKIMEEAKPNTETTKALLIAYALLKSGQIFLKNIGMKNAMEKPPKKRKKPPMATHLQVGFKKISFIAPTNLSTVDLCCTSDAIGFTCSYFLASHLPLFGLKMKKTPRTDMPMDMNAIRM